MIYQCMILAGKISILKKKHDFVIGLMSINCLEI